RATDKGVIGRVEGRCKSLASHIQSLGAIEGMEALLPCDAVSVKGPAEVEQQRFNRLIHRMRQCAEPGQHNTRDPASATQEPAMNAADWTRAWRPAPPREVQTGARR